jgi:hypothetical protein
MPEPDEVKAYTHFIAALCKLSKDQKRVSATEKEVDNEKYAFRCFLLRLGFIGNDYKAERKILLKEPLRQLQLEERRTGKGGSSMRMIRTKRA